MSAQYRVAVYGTLREGQHNHDMYLGTPDVTYVGDCELPGFMMLEVWASVPGIVPCVDQQMTVSCELYDVDPKTLARLDGLEGIDKGMYTREKVTTPVFGTVLVYQIGPSTFRNIFRGGRELMFFEDGDFAAKKKWSILRADVGKMLDHQFLREAGLWAYTRGKDVNTPVQQSTNVVPLLPSPPPKPVEPEFNWKRIYGDVVAMQAAEVVRHAE